MKWRQGVLAATLAIALAQPAAAQLRTQEVPVINQLAQQCRSTLKEDLYVSVGGRTYTIGQGADHKGISIDESALEGILKQRPNHVIFYHCHPPTTIDLL